MTSIDQIARIAYETHVRTRTRGQLPTPWNSLPTDVKAAWIAAVQAVRAEIERH